MMAKFAGMLMVVSLLGVMSDAAYAQHGETYTLFRSYAKDRGWLGVSVQDLTASLRERHSLDVKKGAYVSDVVDDSPADEAGIRSGDVITRVDTEAVDGADDLIHAVRGLKPGKSVPVEYVRKNDHKSCTVKIGRTPSFAGSLPSLRRFYSFPGRVRPFVFHMFSDEAMAGMSVQSLTSQLRDYFGAPEGIGVLVAGVEDGSAAAKAGIKAGDVLTKVDAEEIRDVESLQDALSSGDSRDVSVQLLRKGKSESVTLHIEGEQDEDDSSMLDIRPFRHHDGRSFDLPAPFYHPFRWDRLENELRDLEMKLKDRLREVKENVVRGLSEL